MSVFFLKAGNGITRYTEIEGDSISLMCFGGWKMAKLEDTNVTWFKYVDHKWKPHDQTDEKNCKIVDGHLFIDQLEHKNAGDYSCIYRTQDGEWTEISKLIVKKRTRASIEHDEAIAGSRITIKCNVTVDSTFTYNIEWKLNDTNIDFENDLRLIKESENTIVIQSADRSDSGIYTCTVSTDFAKMQNFTVSTELIVIDVPNAPIINVLCKGEAVTAFWQPSIDNGAEILGYTIESKNSFEPDVWEPVISILPNGELEEYTLNYFHRWANYTFHVIASNKIVQSPPSEPSEIREREPDILYRIPRGLWGKPGTTPGEITIYWKPMPPIEHNGPDFHYIIRWK